MKLPDLTTLPDSDQQILSLHRLIYQHRYDALIAVFLVLVGGLASYWGSQLINSVVFDADAGDIWFDADIRRVFFSIINTGKQDFKSYLHPLFSLITYPPGYVLRHVFKLESVTAVRAMIAIAASLWLGLLFFLMRILGCKTLDAFIFSLLAASSAASMFWFVIPESFSFGSLSILIALITVAVVPYNRPYHQLSQWWYVLLNVLTASFTITNWMAGILATFANYRWRRSLRIIFTALAVLVVLSVVQNLIFPASISEFVTGIVGKEQEHILAAESGGPLQAMESFISHTMVMPAIYLVNGIPPSAPLMLRTQLSLPGSGSIWGAIAVGLWTALLGLGTWSLFTQKRHPKFRLVLGLLTLLQLLLHSVYGKETFLYSLHFAPLLIALTALSTLTRARLFALALAITLCVCTCINNVSLFNQARAFLDSSSAHVGLL